jgi:hypothetical protein
MRPERGCPKMGIPFKNTQTEVIIVSLCEKFMKISKNSGPFGTAFVESTYPGTI